MRYKGRYVGTITPELIANHLAHPFTPEAVALRWTMGKVLPIDIGKQFFDMGDGVYQVESNEQRDARLSK